MSERRPDAGPAAARQETIAALATAAGAGGIGVVRVSGPGALDVLERVVTGGAAAREQPRRVFHGWAQDESGAPIDEVLYFAMTAPRSYTGEDVVEIHGHGGAVNMALLLRAVMNAGARQAEAGEFTRRAFENGRLDLTRAEAVADVIGAASERACRVAQRQLRGELGNRVRGLYGRAQELMAEVEAGIDFPEEDLALYERDELCTSADLLAADCMALASTFRIGRALGEGIEVALRGPVNAGKSSLLNALCGRERALVADEPGTTRDFVEATCEWDGVAVTLIDTAGERDAESALERRGIELGRERAAEADVEVFLHPAPVTGAADRAEGAAPAREVHVVSKGDLLADVAPTGWLVTSARTGGGLVELRREILARVMGRAADGDDGLVVTSERQRKLLVDAADALGRGRALFARGAPAELAAVEVREAAERLAEILGETVLEGMLDRLFARFCIGK